MRFLSLILILGACSLSEEEEDRLAAHLQRAQIYFDASKFPQAQQQANLGLIIEPENPTLNHIMGRTLLGMRDIQSVRNSGSFLKVAHDGLDSPHTAYSLGEYHLRLAQFMLGRSEHLKARAVGLPDEEAQDMKTRAARTESHAGGELLLARELLEVAVAQSPENSHALRLLANCCAHQRDGERAMAVLGELVQILEESRSYKNEKLALQSLSVSDETRLRKRVRADITAEIRARGLIATIHMDSKNYAPAELEFNQILNLDPAADEYYNRGLCRYYLGRLGEAASDMRTFLGRTSLEFKSETASRALDIVSQYEALQKTGAAPSP